MKISEIMNEAKDDLADKKYPNDRDGVKAMLNADAQKSFLKRLDLDGPNTTIHKDPSVSGVWAVDNSKTGERVIVYLAGYKDPQGNVREFNDFEVGTKSKVKEAKEGDRKLADVEFDTLVDLLTEYIQYNEDAHAKEDVILKRCTAWLKRKHPEYNDVEASELEGAVTQATYRVLNN